MKYPGRGEYATAIKYLDKFVLDNVLKKGKPVTQSNNPNLLFSINGGKAIVYQIQANPKKYALKCWVEDLGDLKIRYQAIDNHLKMVKLPYFVDFAYQEQGIVVNGQKFPIVRMEWVDGVSFKGFISNNINNPVYIRDFAEKFLEMVTILHQNNMSHGDLQHGNIKVRSNGHICLIDYDSVYVPELKNEKDNIKGLPGYQHPNRNNLDKLSPKSDYFSELIIYLSLLVISEQPQYWQKIEDEERLLFSEKDLINPSSSPTFKELKQLSSEIVYFTEQLEKSCQTSDVEYLLPLDTLVSAYTGSKISWDFPTNPSPSLSPPSPPPKVIINSNPKTFAILAQKPTQTDASSNSKVSDIWEETFGTNTPDIWEETFGTNPSNPWEKEFDTTTTPSKKTEPTTDKNSWNKFDNIWDKLSKSVSSIWHKIFNWFN